MRFFAGRGLPRVAKAQSVFARFWALNSATFLRVSSLSTVRNFSPGLIIILARAHSALARFLAVNFAAFSSARQQESQRASINGESSKLGLYF